MTDYFKRVITYDPKTQNYKVEIPDLGIYVLSDTEASGLIEIRKELEDYVKRVAAMPLNLNPQEPDDFWDSLDLKAPSLAPIPSGTLRSANEYQSTYTYLSGCYYYQCVAYREVEQKEWEARYVR